MNLTERLIRQRHRARRALQRQDRELHVSRAWCSCRTPDFVVDLEPGYSLTVHEVDHEQKLITDQWLAECHPEVHSFVHSDDHERASTRFLGQTPLARPTEAQPMFSIADQDQHEDDHETDEDDHETGRS